MLTIKAAAERMGVSAQTVYGLCAARRLRHTRVGRGRGVIRVPEEALAEYLRGREVGAGEPSPQPPPATYKPVKLKNLRLS